MSVRADATARADDALASATLVNGASRLQPENGLDLPTSGHAEWRPSEALTTAAGSLSVWVRPHWSLGDARSHPIVSFRWSGDDGSYFALSQGWWEPAGAGKLHAVLSNQQFVSCVMPWRFNYTLFLNEEWTQLAVSWRAGHPGFLRLYVDGKLACERRTDFEGDRRSTAPMFLGSDQPTGAEGKGRPADMDIRDLKVQAHPLSGEEVRALYRSGGGGERPKWIEAITSSAATPASQHERRVMQDEDTGWAASRSEIRRRVERVKAAGFNIYMPNVWTGALAYFLTEQAPVAPGLKDPKDASYDPLRYLIDYAHGQGLEVHPWIIVTRNPGGSQFPESYTAGAPPDAFNIQDGAFRDFLVKLVDDIAARYPIDGLNLDYIRAIGPCSDPRCVEGYAAKFHRSMQADWDEVNNGKTVPSLIEWNRAATGDIVRRVSAAVRVRQPQALLTIDTIPFDHSRQHQGLDEELWVARGWIDAVIDMAYDDPLDVEGVDHGFRTFSAAHFIVDMRNYDLYDERQVPRSGAVLEDYVRLVRERWPGAGISFYQYPRLAADQIQSLGAGSFRVVSAPQGRQ